MRKVPLPDKSTPLLEADGKTMSQAWFDWCRYTHMRGVLDASDVDVSGGISNGQVLIYNSTAGKLKPGAN